MRQSARAKGAPHDVDDPEGPDNCERNEDEDPDRLDAAMTVKL